MSPELQLIIKQAAHDDCGFYPKSVQHGDGTVEQRTAWQDGWNAALMATTEKEMQFEVWFGQYPKKEALEKLLIADQVNITTFSENNQITIVANMNDTFAYACSDEEEVLPEEIELVCEMFELFSFDGVIAWAAKKRKAEPIKPYLTKQFFEAMFYLEKKI